MSYILLHENETLEQALELRTKIADSDIECYKIIEERMSGSGRIEYWTYPLFHELNEDIVTGKALQHPKEEPTPKQTDNAHVSVDKGYVHAYKNYVDALEYINNTTVGYTETRPVIYKCVIPKGERYILARNHTMLGGEPYMVYAASALRYCEPITQKVSGKSMPYAKMTKPEPKKKNFGIIYDESQINGDVNNNDEE